MNRASDKPKEQPQEVITMGATKLEELVKTLDAWNEADGVSTPWVKVKNRAYSQMLGPRDVFEARQDRPQRSRPDWRAPVLRLALPVLQHRC